MGGAYDHLVSSPDDMLKSVSSGLQERTGRTLDEWVAIVQESGIDPLDQRAVRASLKDEHGILQNSQWAIADAAARAVGWVRPTLQEYVDNQYVGAKATLRPIFDRIQRIAIGLGEDVSVEGRGWYTPFVRRRQFAAVAAATRTRVDLGLRFVSAPDSKRLTPARAPGQSTHKIGFTSPEQVDDEVARLIRVAYEQNG
jgi:hypothetical protein